MSGHSIELSPMGTELSKPLDWADIEAALAVHGTDATVCDPLGRGTPNCRAEYDGDAEGDARGLIAKHGDDAVRSLVIAGALIAAEIDRILRSKALPTLLLLLALPLLAYGQESTPSKTLTSPMICGRGGLSGTKEFNDCCLGATTSGSKLTVAATQIGWDHRCPVCVKQGKESKVYPSGLGCTCTLMATYDYYDEKGVYHHSDPNWTTCTFTCSNGHDFSVSSREGEQSIAIRPPRFSMPRLWLSTGATGKERWYTPLDFTFDAAWAAAAIGDRLSTTYALKHCPTCYETIPIPSTNARTTISFALIGTTDYLQYKYPEKRKIIRWFKLGPIGYGLFGIFHNRGLVK